MIQIEVVGLSEEKIKKISNYKGENDYFLNYRLNGYKVFKELSDPSFGPKYHIDYDKIVYYKGTSNDLKNNWEGISCSVKDEFSSLGVIDSEKHMDGLGVQYESEMIYHNMLKELEDKKVIFTSIDDAIQKYPDLVKKYFGTIVSPHDNKFAALNACVFSGGSFIYIPKNTKLDRPLQSYFRINQENLGQFERTLIIVDDNAYVHYNEGCTAPIYDKNNLHAAAVEIFIGKNAHCRYSTIQNWSDNVLNLVTKRAIVEENGIMEWIDGNLGSKLNMKYPATILKGDKSKGKCISIAVSHKGVIQDAGAKMIHIGRNTRSQIISKSIAHNGGNATYRGLVQISKSAVNSASEVVCDTLILDKISKSDTYPTEKVFNKSSVLKHEAKVTDLDKQKLFYLQSRGIDLAIAKQLLVLGFIEDFSNELPLEYSVELNRLLKLDIK